MINMSMSLTRWNFHSPCLNNPAIIYNIYLNAYKKNKNKKRNICVLETLLVNTGGTTTAVCFFAAICFCTRKTYVACQ